MLNQKHFDLQAKMLAHDISRITARYLDRLKPIYANPAKQIYKLNHTLTTIVFSVDCNAPADVAAEIQAVYEQRFL